MKAIRLPGELRKRRPMPILNPATIDHPGKPLRRSGPISLPGSNPDVIGATVHASSIQGDMLLAPLDGMPSLD